MRGPRKVRTKIGPWPIILFVVLNVLVAIVGRWIESHYEGALQSRSQPPKSGEYR
jgi:hypothetical protein